MGNFSKQQQEKKKVQKALEQSKRDGTYAKLERKKTLKICVIVALVIAIPLSMWLISYIKNIGDRYFTESEMVINEVDTTHIPDGIYYARFDNGNMTATVGVTLADGKMTEIAIYDYSNISTEKADKLFGEIIEYQMLNIPDAKRDYSELVLLKTVEAALKALSTTMPT